MDTNALSALKDLDQMYTSNMNTNTMMQYLAWFQHAQWIFKRTKLVPN